MVSRYLYLSAILAVAVGCDSSFTGEGFGGLGGAQKFRTGDGNPQGYPRGPGGPGSNNGNPGNYPFGGGGGGDGSDGNFYGGGGFTGTTFSDASIMIERADGSKNNQYNHDDVMIELKVGQKTTGKVAIGSKGASATLEGVCTSGTPVAFDLTVYHKGQTIKPKKGNYGGLLFFRLGPEAIRFGYEYHALGERGDEAKADNNDDLIGVIRCIDNADTEGNPIEINLTSNACFDQRIDQEGWLSPKKSAGTSSRLCTGK